MQGAAEEEPPLMSLTHGPGTGENDEGESKDHSLWGMLDIMRFRANMGPWSYYNARITPLPLVERVPLQKPGIIARKPVPRPLPPLPEGSKPRPLPPLPEPSTIQPTVYAVTIEEPDVTHSALEPPAPQLSRGEDKPSQGKNKGKGKGKERAP